LNLRRPTEIASIAFRWPGNRNSQNRFSKCITTFAFTAAAARISRLTACGIDARHERGKSIEPGGVRHEKATLSKIRRRIVCASIAFAGSALVPLQPLSQSRFGPYSGRYSLNFIPEPLRTVLWADLEFVVKLPQPMDDS
jgi:hypothetical protein